MTALNAIASTPRTIAGIFCMFFAIMGVRWTYPVIDIIMGYSWNSGIMRVTAILIMWLLYTFVLFILVWQVFFAPTLKETKGETKNG